MGNSFKQLWNDAKDLVVGAGRVLRDHRIGFGLFAAGFLALGLLVHPHDIAWHERITSNRTSALRHFARQLSFWGDLPTGSVIVAATVWIAGLIRRRRKWQRAAVACLLAALVAGLFANGFRFTMGRARPSTDLPDGFYGPSLQNNLHGFPSAHAVTSFGTATALIVTLPAVGIPLLAGAGGVVWSRMYLEQHYPMDVIVGAGIGTLFGIAFGLAARRKSADETVPYGVAGAPPSKP